MCWHYTHTHTHIHSLRHAPNHTRPMRTHTCAQKHARLHTYVYTVHMHTHTHMHIAHTHMHGYTHASTHAELGFSGNVLAPCTLYMLPVTHALCVHIHTHMHSYTYTYTYSHTHTHTVHIHMQSWASRAMCWPPMPWCPRAAPCSTRSS